MGLSVRPPTFFISLLSAAAGFALVADACLLGVRLSVSSVLPDVTLAGSDFTPLAAAGIAADLAAVVKIALHKQAHSFTNKGALPDVSFPNPSLHDFAISILSK